MKILLIAPCFGAYGGIETFVLRLAQEINLHGHDVTVAFKKVKGFELKDSLRHKINDSKALVLFADRFSFETVKLLKSHDLVHTHNPLFEIILTCRALRIPVVSTVYNWSRRNWAIRPILWRFANWLSYHSWYISEFVWDSWEPKKRRDSSNRLPIISELPTGYTHPSQRRGFIFVSRWIENKGLRTLIKAYREANIDKEAWPLTLIGDGPLKEEVLNDIEQKPCDNIEITGFISSEERNERIRNAKWMVTPPNTNEDLGLTPLEARNVHVPCIASKDGGILETGGKGAIWCEPGSVKSLRKALEKAASLPDSEYEKIAKSTQEDLGDYISSLGVYIEEYKRILRI